MNDDNHYLLVGGFVTAVVVGLIALLVSVAGDSSSETRVRYQIFFEQDVSGLSIGAPVRYLGVDVGAVTNIDLSPRSRREVAVVVAIDESTPVTSATYATLAFQGVTGVAFVSLSADAEADETPIARRGDDYPVIPSRTTGLTALLNSSGEITQQISLVLSQISTVLSEDNRASVASTVRSLSELTEALAANREDIAALPRELSEAVQQINKTLATLQGVVEDAEPGIAAAVVSLGDVTEDLAAVSRRLDAWTEDNDIEIRAFLDGGLGQTPALVADVRAAVIELQRLLRELRDDPAQIIYQRNTDDIEVTE